MNKYKERFIKFLEENHNGEYKLISDYKDNETDVELLHSPCGHKYSVKPHCFKRKNNRGLCPFCEITTKNCTKEQFLFKLNKIYPDEFELISDFINMNVKIIVKHKKCGKQFSVTPHFLLYKTYCPFCSHRSYSYQPDYVKKEIKELTNGEYEVLSDYKKENIPIDIKHVKCGTIFHSTRKNFIYNHTRCPYCYNMGNRSKYVEFIENILKENNIIFDREVYFDDLKGYLGKRYLKFDLYIEELNTIIEYDGEQHFRKTRFYNYYEEILDRYKKNDSIKNEYFIDNDTPNLLRIHFRLKHNDIKNIINELIKNKRNLSSTTIEKYKLLFISNKKVYNLKEYYTNLNNNYFE